MVYAFNGEWVVVLAVRDGVVTVRYEEDPCNRQYHYHASDARWLGRTTFKVK